MKDYEVIDPYGTYETKSGDDPYSMLMKMSSWNKELRSTISVINEDLSESQTQIIQNSEQILLRVSKDTAVGEINLSPEGIRLAGKLIHLSGTSLIDNAVIKSAHIQSLAADKILANTLSAISANLGSITAGDISGVSITGSILTSDSGGNSMTLRNGSIYWNDGIPSQGASIYSSYGAMSLNASQSIGLKGNVYVQGSLNLSNATVTGYSPNIDLSGYARAHTSGLGIAFNGNDRLYVRINGSDVGYVTLS